MRDLWKIFLPAFVGVTLWMLLWSPFGIDFCDYGWSILCGASTIDPDHAMDGMCFLTEMVSGLWLKWNPVGHPWLWWIALGGTLLWGIVAGLNALIVQKLFHCDARKTVLLTWAGFLLFPVCNQDIIINYYTFPALLVTLYIFVLLKIQQGSHGWWTVMFLGFLNAIMIFARLPHVFMCGAPILLWFANLFCSEERVPIRWGLVLKWCVGLVVGVVLILFFKDYWLHSAGIIEGTTNAASVADSTNTADATSATGAAQGGMKIPGVRTIFANLYVFLTGWWRRLGIGVLTLWLVMACTAIAKRSTKLAMLPAIGFMAMGCLLPLSAIVSGFSWHEFHFVALIPFVGTPFLLLCLMAFWEYDVLRCTLPISPKIRAFLVTLTLVVTGFPVGTDGSPGVARMAYLCMLPTAILMFLLLMYVNAKRENRWALCGFGVLTFAFFTPFCNVIDGAKFQCTQFSSLPELRWTASTPDRMKEIEENFRRVREYVKPRDELYYIGQDSLWIYLLDVETPGRHYLPMCSGNGSKVSNCQRVARERWNSLPMYAMTNVDITLGSNKFHPGDYWTYENVIAKRYEEVFRNGDVIFWKLKTDPESQNMPWIEPEPESKKP